MILKKVSVNRNTESNQPLKIEKEGICGRGLQDPLFRSNSEALGLIGKLFHGLFPLSEKH